jgi:hypothetical protein
MSHNNNDKKPAIVDKELLAKLSDIKSKAIKNNLIVKK